MTVSTASERARTETRPAIHRDTRILGHPLAFLATAALLLTLFGWTFVVNQDRVAPTKDPAYYTWRTETLISEDPQTLLEVEGAHEMFSGGHRVAASVIGGYLRRVPAISSLNTTVLLMVGVPVLTALLVAGFAYRHRRDPLIFHVVALGVASLYLTPPFVGYLDNVLCLMFLAAALWFIGPSRTSWAGRAGLFLFLLLAGFTHPTTLVIFCATLGVVSLLRLIFRKFDLRSVIRDDLAMLVTAFVAALATLAIWQFGLWGKSTSLAEAALPPPYDSDFFLERMGDWVAAMTPVLNGPLLVIGLIGLFVAGRRWVEDEFSVVTFAWLAPLAGLFGFVGGLTYPYYRFFNTTLSWVVLVGLGGYLLIRFVGDQLGPRGTVGAVATGLAAVAVGAIFALNFAKGYDVAGWNDPNKGWLSNEERSGLDALRVNLLAATGEGGEEAEAIELDQVVNDERPVVFVIDSDTEGFQVWGETKLAGNTSRYGLPAGLVDQGYLYLGSVENFLNDEPTFVGEGQRPTEECAIGQLGNNTYNCLSVALLEDARAGIERADAAPIVVVADIFNATGSNVEFVASGGDLPEGTERLGTEMWTVSGNEVTRDGQISTVTTEEDEGTTPLHLGRALLCLALLMLPGAIALRFFFPGASFGEAVAVVPALAVGMLTIVGIVVLAIVRSPFNSLVAWACVALTIVLAAVLSLRGAGTPPARTSTAEP